MCGDFEVYCKICKKVWILNWITFCTSSYWNFFFGHVERYPHCDPSLFTKLPNILGYFESKIAARNGTSPKYRSREVLSNTIDDDYDKESIEIVCKIYETNVIMQRSLGMEVSRCDPFIPRKKYFLWFWDHPWFVVDWQNDN